MLASRRLTLALTYAGALPFLFLLPVKLPFLQGGDTLAMFIAYGAIISSFMAGSLWGLLQARETPPFVQIIGSNVLALISWLSLLIEPGRAALLIQLATFISLLTVERTLAATGLEKDWYWQLRTRITMVVSIAYVAKIFLI